MEQSYTCILESYIIEPHEIAMEGIGNFFKNIGHNIHQMIMKAIEFLKNILIKLRILKKKKDDPNDELLDVDDRKHRRSDLTMEAARELRDLYQEVYAPIDTISTYIDAIGYNDKSTKDQEELFKLLGNNLAENLDKMDESIERMTTLFDEKYAGKVHGDSIFDTLMTLITVAIGRLQVLDRKLSVITREIIANGQMQNPQYMANAISAGLAKYINQLTKISALIQTIQNS